jgi:hypothetical protein
MPFHTVWPSGHVDEYIDLATYLKRHIDFAGCVVYWSICEPGAERIELHVPADLERTAYQLISALRLDAVFFSDASGVAVSGEIEGIDFEAKRDSLTAAVWGVLQMHEDEHPEPVCPDCGGTYRASCCQDAAASVGRMWG